MRKEGEKEVEQVIEKMVKGMRKKMSTVLWRIERSRDVSPEPIKSMLQNGLEAMVSEVEEAMIGISNGMVEERKEKEQV
jgi:hypothetical protein